jgi:hypothetical protein
LCCKVIVCFVGWCGAIGVVFVVHLVVCSRIVTYE